MKKLILLALTALMMAGCKYQTDAEIEEAKRLNGFNIVVYDNILNNVVDCIGFSAPKNYDGDR